jgi:hypothetical protein
MADVFISYSRRDADFAHRLNAALAAQDRDVWVDQEDIPAIAEWRSEIQQAIEAAGAVLFVITPDSARSEVCRQEIEHAVRYRKRLVPVLHRDTDPRELPAEVAALNWIFLRDGDDFERGVRQITTAMDTDLAWVRTHTLLLTRALEWDRKTRSGSLLLRGTELESAERDLAHGAGKDPRPTELQADYVLASRRAATSGQRKLLGGISTALVIMAVLAVVAWQQRGRALTELRIATAQNLAAQAQIAYVTVPYHEEMEEGGESRGVLLALESLDAFPSVEGDLALRQGMWKLPGSPLEVPLDEGVELVGVGPQGGWLIVDGGQGPQALDPATGAHRPAEAPTAQAGAGLRAGADDPLFPGEDRVWSADHRLYLVDTQEGLGEWHFASVAVHRASDGRKLAVLPHDWHLKFAAFSPDNRWLVTVTGRVSRDASDPAATRLPGSTIHVWEIPSGRRVTEVSLVHQGDIEEVALSPDGNWLATAISRATGSAWPPADEQPTARAVLLWPLWPELLRAEACRRLRRNLSDSEWMTFMGRQRRRATCPGLPVVSE